MRTFLKEAADRTFTENGAVTYRSSGSDCLDLFATIGALRGQSNSEIETRFLRAFAENADLAMKTLFYARDIRGGLGERAVFRTLLVYLAEHEKPSLIRNLPLIPEYGRWDDVLVLLETPARQEAEAFLKKQFQADLEAMKCGNEVSLLGKWLPSVNASNPEAVRRGKQLARAFGMNDASYRKALSALRAKIRIIENNLRKDDYTFDYAKQPSGAMLKYRKAFRRNDGKRYRMFMEQAAAGKTTLHTGTLTPYEIVEKAYGADEDRRSLDIMWNALQDFTNDENALVVADGSGSMYGSGRPMPAVVAQSLAIYFAERNSGAFHNFFITFSDTPQLVEIKGRDIVEKVRYCRSFDEVASTNLQAVFELILNAAIQNHVPQKDLPQTLYIITDMEFNSCTRNASSANFDYARDLYEAYGYRLPVVVFWNVQSRTRQQPVKMDERGVTLVSGCSPRIFSQVMKHGLSPYEYMMSVLEDKRYEIIRA